MTSVSVLWFTASAAAAGAAIMVVIMAVATARKSGGIFVPRKTLLAPATAYANSTGGSKSTPFLPDPRREPTFAAGSAPSGSGLDQDSPDAKAIAAEAPRAREHDAARDAPEETRAPQPDLPWTDEDFARISRGEFGATRPRGLRGDGPAPASHAAWPGAVPTTGQTLLLLFAVGLGLFGLLHGRGHLRAVWHSYERLLSAGSHAAIPEFWSPASDAPAVAEKIAASESGTAADEPTTASPLKAELADGGISQAAMPPVETLSGSNQTQSRFAERKPPAHLKTHRQRTVQAPTRQVVVRIQKSLNKLGYRVGVADGVLGPRTRRAIREFQADAGLEPSGEIDHRLIESLQAEAAAM